MSLSQSSKLQAAVIHHNNINWKIYSKAFSTEKQSHSPKLWEKRYRLKLPVSGYKKHRHRLGLASPPLPPRSLRDAIIWVYCFSCEQWVHSIILYISPSHVQSFKFYAAFHFNKCTLEYYGQFFQIV